MDLEDRPVRPFSGERGRTEWKRLVRELRSLAAEPSKLRRGMLAKTRGRACSELLVLVVDLPILPATRTSDFDSFFISFCCLMYAGVRRMPVEYILRRAELGCEFPTCCPFSLWLG